MTKPLISILTPTYNRGDLLERVFDSLKHQTIQNFEWIIIDDGSTDNTKKIIKNFNLQEFKLQYLYKDNGGKHTALNLGIKKAQGDFILILDSDDYLTYNAIEILENEIIKNNYESVAFRRIDEFYKIIGNNNFNEIIATPLEIRYKHNVTGDLVEVFKKEILLNYPFPLFKNEKFCPEALIWNRIAQNHSLKYINQGFYVSEYLEGGLTSSIVKIRMNSPKATLTHYSELASYNIPFKEKIKANINFWRFSFNEKDWSFKRKVKMVQPIFTPLCLPLGFLMFLNDKRRVK